MDAMRATTATRTRSAPCSWSRSRYARAGLADYWILNLPDRRLEVYRGPVADAAARFGWRYGNALALGPAERVAPLAAPGATLLVADLLPKIRRL